MFTTINGLKLHYLVEGTGIPCVVPTLVGTPILERTFSPELRKRLQLVFLELRAGRSEVGSIEDTTLDSLVDDIDRFRQALHLEKIALIGFSRQGQLALRYAECYAECTSRIILIGALPALDSRYAEERHRYWESLASEQRKAILWRNTSLSRVSTEALSRATPSRAIVMDYVASGPMFWRDPNFDCAYLWEGHTLDAGIVERFWGEGGALSGFDPDQSFPKITCPVLIVAGLFDFTAPPTTWFGIKEKLKNHSYRVFEQSGHYPQFEEQKLFDATVVSWLAPH